VLSRIQEVKKWGTVRIDFGVEVGHEGKREGDQNLRLYERSKGKSHWVREGLTNHAQKNLLIDLKGKAALRHRGGSKAIYLPDCRSYEEGERNWNSKQTKTSCNLCKEKSVRGGGDQDPKA